MRLETGAEVVAITGIKELEGDSLADGGRRIGAGKIAEGLPEERLPSRSGYASGSLSSVLERVQFSRMTCAIACSTVCDSDRAAFLTPSFAANSAAFPWKAMLGRPPGMRVTSQSRQRTP